MLDASVLEALLERQQRRSIGLKDDCVGAGTQVTWGAFTRCVRDLRGQDSDWEVGPHHDVVSDRVESEGLILPRGLSVNRSWLYGNHASKTVKPKRAACVV